MKFLKLTLAVIVGLFALMVVVAIVAPAPSTTSKTAAPAIHAQPTAKSVPEAPKEDPAPAESPKTFTHEQSAPQLTPSQER